MYGKKTEKNPVSQKIDKQPTKTVIGRITPADKPP